MTRRRIPAADRGRHERPPPRRDAGWIVLLALTLVGILAALRAGGPDGDPPPADPVVATSSPTTSEQPSTPPSPTAEETPTPTGPRVVERGSGRFVHAPATPRDNRRDGRVVRWTLEAEEGLGIDLDEYAKVASATLLGKRGWQGKGGVRFVRVTEAEAERGERIDVRMILASPATTDRLCAPLRTAGKVSCWNEGKAVLNSRRWLTGADAYEGRLDDYRTYLVNHEVGHGLGYGHLGCPKAGERAPVMMQQTLGVEGCRPWPYP